IGIDIQRHRGLARRARADVVAHDLAAAERRDVEEPLVGGELDAVRAGKLRAGDRLDVAAGPPFVDFAVDLAGDDLVDAFARVVEELRRHEAAVAANRDGVRPDAVGQRHAADPRSRRLVAANVELERLNRFERAVARRVKPIDTGRALAYREAVRIERVEIEAGRA